VYLAFNAPHSASNLNRRIRGIPQAPGKYLDLYPSGDDLRSEIRRKYMASVTAMDEAIGRILARLDKLGLARDTLVFFLSDNGGGSGSDNSPLRGRKSWMFEGGVRVPCIVRWPGRLPAGVVSDEFLTALELFPTFVAAASARIPDGLVLDGFDMLHVLAGERRSPRKEMFWLARGEYAARVGRWKLVHSRRGSGLFDLEADVGESNDLSRREPETLSRVESRYRTWLREMEAAEPRGPFRDY
ncbi:MAG TPA: N-acetylgalactosamine-6-sulfatase, partial [Rhodospirillales bacterium]|nr:N-acetylgalactosamine-6-sulfatase [Rhodospirillales bacterium]